MFKGRQFESSLIRLCVRRYLSYRPSLRDLEEMIAERGIGFEHSMIHRRVIRYAQRMLEAFRGRKRTAMPVLSG